jgi:hypothetical protein
VADDGHGAAQDFGVEWRRKGYRLKTIPSDVFSHCLLDGGSPKLARARRLIVTAWLLHPSLDHRSSPELFIAARAVWDTHVYALNRPGRVTVVTVLAKLRELGFVDSFDAVEGGYAVKLVKEAA